MKTIYYLFEIGENIPRYVGVTKQELRVRLNSHKCSKGNVKREVWIRDAQTRLGIGIKELERCEDNIAIEREIFWTNELSKDYDLCNLRIGNGTSKELSKILSYGQKNKKEINWAALRITHEKARGQKRNKDFCDKLSLRFKGVPKSKEVGGPFGNQACNEARENRRVWAKQVGLAG